MNSIYNNDNNNTYMVNVTEKTMRGLREISEWLDCSIPDAFACVLAVYISEADKKMYPKGISVPVSDANFAYLAKLKETGADMDSVLNDALSAIASGDEGFDSECDFEDDFEDGCDELDREDNSCKLLTQLVVKNVIFAGGAAGAKGFLQENSIDLCAEKAAQRETLNLYAYRYAAINACADRIQFNPSPGNLEYLRNQAFEGRSWAATVNDALDMVRPRTFEERMMDRLERETNQSEDNMDSADGFHIIHSC